MNQKRQPKKQGTPKNKQSRAKKVEPLSEKKDTKPQIVSLCKKANTPPPSGSQVEPIPEKAEVLPKAEPLSEKVEAPPKVEPLPNLNKPLTSSDFVRRNEIHLYWNTKLSEFSQGLTQTELAKRWKLRSSVIGQHRRDQAFGTWSQQRDPEGITWDYRPANKKNIPQYFPINIQ